MAPPLLALSAGPACLLALPALPLADLWSRPAVPQRWVWHHLIPCGHASMLAGHGGVRKSSLVTRLGVCVAMGLPFLGVPTTQGRVCYFSAEDPGELVRLRLGHICRDLGTDPATLAQSLDVLDATEGQPALFAEVRAPGVRMATTTATYEALRQHVDATRPALLIVDNASDTYAADEIDRASVRGFVRALALLVREWDGAVLLVAHVDKATSRTPKGMGSNTESYSGSTAWHNSVRSRMFLAETSPGVFELAHQKSNLGPKREPITVIWPADGPPHVLEAAQVNTEDGNLRALLGLIAEFAGRGEHCSTSQSGHPNIAKLFGSEPSYPRGMKVAEALAILRDGERRNLLAREQYRTPDRKLRERFAITDLGRQFLASAPTAPTVRQVEVGAVSTPALGAPAPTAGGCGGLAHPTVLALEDPSNTPDVHVHSAHEWAA